MKKPKGESYGVTREAEVWQKKKDGIRWGRYGYIYDPLPDEVKIWRDFVKSIFIMFLITIIVLTLIIIILSVIS